MNRFTRERWNIPDEVISWSVVSRLIHADDIAGFEDCQSRVLKCGGVYHQLVRFRGEADEWYQAWHTVQAAHDPVTGAGVVLVLLRGVERLPSLPK